MFGPASNASSNAAGQIPVEIQSAGSRKPCVRPIAVRVSDEVFLVKLQRWVDVTDLPRIPMWAVPLGEEWDSVGEVAGYEPPPPARLALWTRDRLLGTYLDEWRTESLHLEYRYHNPILTVSNLVACAVIDGGSPEAGRRLRELEALSLEDEPGMWLWSTACEQCPRVV